VYITCSNTCIGTKLVISNIWSSTRIDKALEAGKEICLVCLDVRKGFDRVWHSGVLRCLVWVWWLPKQVIQKAGQLLPHVILFKYVIIQKCLLKGWAVTSSCNIVQICNNFKIFANYLFLLSIARSCNNKEWHLILDCLHCACNIIYVGNNIKILYIAYLCNALYDVVILKNIVYS
jgi:hypothetical protein